MAKADVEKLTGLIKDLKLKDQDETKNRQAAGKSSSWRQPTMQL